MYILPQAALYVYLDEIDNTPNIIRLVFFTISQPIVKEDRYLGLVFVYHNILV